MKKYEIESLVKGFLLIFTLISSIYALFLWQNDTSQKYQLDKSLLKEMELFAFDPTSDKYNVDFLPPRENVELFTLYHTKEEVYSFFKVPTEDNYLMKVSLPMDKHMMQINAARALKAKWLALYGLLIAMISLFLAYYSLQPIRQALRINKEFMKDIIHDINTPVASIAVNLKLLQKHFGKHKVIDRVYNNIQTIGMLTDNIHSYLGSIKEESSEFELKVLIDERLDYFRVLYPQLKFKNELADDIVLDTRKATMVRILDNIIGNAARYNKKNGSITVSMEEDVLIIADTGRGIQNVSKVFDRHYKESDRGMGLGLHIVRTLSKKLKLDISIESEVDNGTKVKINCKKVATR